MKALMAEMKRPDQKELVARLAERQAERLRRLSGDQDEALSKTRELIAKFVDQRPAQRARGDDAEALLLRVVEVYNDAVARGERAPRAAVARRLHYHETHIGRLLTKARSRGLLPPAKPRGKRKTR